MENGESQTQFSGDGPYASAHIKIANEKYNCDESELAKEKRGHFLYHSIYPNDIFLNFLSVISQFRRFLFLI